MRNELRQMLDLGIEAQNKYAYGTKEYQLAEKITAFACERNREEEKVRTVFEPPIVGSLEEKLEHEAWVEFNENLEPQRLKD